MELAKYILEQYQLTANGEFTTYLTTHGENVGELVSNAVISEVTHDNKCTRVYSCMRADGAIIALVYAACVNLVDMLEEKGA